MSSSFAATLCNDFITTESLLNLWKTTSEMTGSIEMQIVLNKFLLDATDAEFVFIIPLLSLNEEGIIQVINETVLTQELRFSVSPDDIENIEERGFKILDSDLDRDFNEIIEMVVGKHSNYLIFDVKTTHWMNPRISSRIDSDAILEERCGHNTSFFVCMGGEISAKTFYQECISKVFQYTKGHLLTAIELSEEKRVRMQCRKLLKMAQKILGKIGDLSELLIQVMSEARNLAGAERSSLFLIDDFTNELVAKVFDGSKMGASEIRIEFGVGIVGHVAQTGKLLNIRNAYSHPYFYNGIDMKTGFKTKNILCFPIRDENKIIGVAELCNKQNGYHFDKCDEEIATAFSLYCGVAIMHAFVHKEVQKAEARFKISQELLIYRLQLSTVEMDNFLNPENDLNLNEIEGFRGFEFIPKNQSSTDSIKQLIAIFYDLDFMNKFKIHRNELVQFLITVKRGYREHLPYHNFKHAFDVCHFAYLLIVNLKLLEKEILSDLEGLLFLISCLCHDLDHRGVTNSYQMDTQSTLSCLYSSEGSVNERHHLAQAIYILNRDNNKVLNGLTNNEFNLGLHLLEEMILATDLAEHFKIFSELKDLNTENIMQNKALFRSLLMTCCDISNCTKPFEEAEQYANAVFEEFFAQGDLEKTMGKTPDLMMDREKANIPAIQIEFSSNVCRPVFEILANCFPDEAQILVEKIDENLIEWKKILK